MNSIVEGMAKVIYEKCLNANNFPSLMWENASPSMRSFHIDVARVALAWLEENVSDRMIEAGAVEIATLYKHNEQSRRCFQAHIRAAREEG